MSALIKIHLLLLSCVIALIISAGDILASTPEHDWDMRCCFSQEQMDKAPFIITITGRKSPVAHLILMAPNTSTVGFDNKSNKFFLPNIEGTYAYGPQEHVPTDHPQWGSKISRVIILNRLSKGTYKLSVVGRHSGAYTLSILPHGLHQPGSKKIFKNISIRPGETHNYTFSGWASAANNDLPSTKTMAPFNVRRVTSQP